MATLAAVYDNVTEFGSTLSVVERKDWDSVPEHWRNQEPISYGVHLAVGIFMIPVTVIAVIGNGLVIWIFSR